MVLLRDPNLPSGQRSVGQWFDTTAIAPPLQGTAGAAPRFAFIGPGENNWDMALLKRVPLSKERMNLSFRAEAYNLGNHPQFDEPQKDLSAPNFGQITYDISGTGGLTPGDYRVVQLAMKFIF